MNKFLRYSLVALLMFIGGKSFAQEVMITFVPAETKATASATEVSKDGVTLSVTAGTMNRDDNYRVNKGQTLTVTSTIGNITKIAFTSTVDDPTANYGAKFDAEPGIFMAEGSAGLWMGNAAEVKLTATDHQVRATEFIIFVDSNGSTPGGGDDPDPSTNDNLLAKFVYKSGTFSESEDGNQITVDYVAVNAEAEISGKMIFDFENGLCTKCTVSALFPTEEMAKAYYDESLANKEKEGIETITIDGKTVTVTMIEGFNTLSKPVIKSMMKMLVDNEQGGLGTQDSPMTPNQANVFAGTLEKDETFDQDVYIKGKIASIKNAFDANYGTAIFFISADGQNDFTFQCYSVYYLENKKWVDGNTQIKVGDEVIICGKVMNFKGNTPETASKKAYIYSLNGVTKNEGGGETPDPQIKSLTIAAALDIINGLEDGKTTAEEYEVKGFVVGTPDFQRKADGSLYGNVNFAIADEKGGATTLTVFRAKDFENASFTEETINRIKEGDEVVVRGKLQKYVKNGEMTPELTNCYLISVTSAAAEGAQVWDFTKWSDATIANLKADAAASKTAGWSDVEKAADAEAGADPTEISKDNCFWCVAEPNADGTLSANGVVIEELKGLVWNSAYSVKRSLAIAVNYPSTSLGNYAGPAYLWLGGGKNKIPCFTIPGVKAGSTITIDAESHKPSEGRGVELYTGVDADNLVDAATMIGDSFKPKEKESHSWTVEKDCDVIVYNTNGCHIYKIEVAAGATGIQAVKTATVGNGYIYNLAGQRVDANYKGVVIKNGQKMIQK